MDYYRRTGYYHFMGNYSLQLILKLVDEDPQIFYTILPYAYVLGVTDAWSKQFEDIALSKPSWYYDPNMTNFNTIYFMTALNHNMNSYQTNMSTVASNSSGSGGFGGGGFSGGGFGGGGGGSW